MGACVFVDMSYIFLFASSLQAIMKPKKMVVENDLFWISFGAR